jgi:hypothetical protein
MRKALRLSLLVVLLACSVRADDIQNGITDDIQNGVTQSQPASRQAIDPTTEVILSLLKSILTLF